MITRPMLLDETGQKIKLALQRVKNKFLGTTTDPVTPGQAGSSGVSPVIQDDTGREIISALNDLADAVKPASKTEQGLVSTDDQEFAGTKTFPGLIIKQRTASTAAGFQFNTFDDLRNGFATMNTYGGAGRRSLYRFIFTEYSLSSTTYEPLSYYESFRLPAPDFDRTASATYDILTTKNLTDIPDADASTRGLVNTGAQTFAGNKRFLERPTVSGSIRYPGIEYVSTDFSSFSDRIGMEYIDTGSATFGQMGNACWSVEVHGNDGSGGVSPYRERYLLPFVTVGRTNSANYNILTSKSPVTIAQGGTGQTGQTAQQSYTPTVKIGTTAQTVSSLSAYYKSWGLMKLIGGRFNLTTTGTGQLIISLPAGFTVPTSAVQPMGILIAPDQKAYHIRVTADGLAAMSNGGSNVAWATGYYCFWAVVMGN